MLLNTLRDSRAQLAAHLLILSVAIVIALRGSVGGYLLVLASLILLGSDFVFYRQRRKQETLAQAEHDPRP
jgi:hypothetical protein